MQHDGCNLPKVSSILTSQQRNPYWVSSTRRRPLDLSGQTLYTYRVINTEDDYYFQIQERHQYTSIRTFGGDFYLDVKNPKLYKKSESSMRTMVLNFQVILLMTMTS